MAGLMSTAKGGKSFKPIPAGVHMARCIRVVDFGIQETSWKGKTNHKHQVWISFEVPGFRVKWTTTDDNDVETKHEGPGIIGSTYTNSIGEKSNLGQHLVNWRGRAFTEAERKGFNLFTILGQPCQLNIVHKAKEDGSGESWANIGAIMGIPKGMEAAPAESELIAYTPGDTEYAGNYDKLPEWMRDKVDAGFNEAVVDDLRQDHPPVASQDDAPDYTAGELGIADGFDDDIPF